MKDNLFKKMFSRIDLTTGNPAKVLLIFSIPLLFSLLIQQVFILVESQIAGNFLNSTELLAISNTYTLVYIITNFASGITSGFSVILSRATGAKNNSDAKRSIAMQIKLNLYFSVGLTAIFVIFLKQFIQLIGVNPASSEFNTAYFYCLFLVCGIIFEHFFYMTLNFYRSIGESFNSFLYLLIFMVLGISFDFMFILGFNLGLNGLAFANLSAKLITLILGIVYFFIKHKHLIPDKGDFKFNPKFAWSHIKLGVPIALNYTIISIGLLSIQKGINRFGDAKIAYNYSSKYMDFFMSTYNALGSATLAYIGQNYGSNNFYRIKKGHTYAQLFGVVISAIIAIITIPTSINGTFLHIFINNENLTSQILEYGAIYNIYPSVCVFLLSFLIISRSAVQGLGKSWQIIVCGVVETLVRSLGANFLPQLICPENPQSISSFHALAALQPISWVGSALICGITLIIFFRKNKEIIENQKNLELANKENS